MTRSKHVLLKERPGERISESDLVTEERDIPDLADGEFLVENRYASIDFAMRGWLAAGRSYVPTLELDGVVRASTAGEVTSSRHPEFAKGDHVCGMLGMQTHAVSNGEGIYKVDTTQAPLSRWAGGLGLTTALTAHLGLLRIGRPRRGDTVLVSGASGAVGSLVGQIAKITGCTAVGVAGGSEKCSRVVNNYGFDACVDYKSDDLARHIAAACPDRIDVLFENVGGAVFDASLLHLNTYGRIVLCGLTSDRIATDGPYGVTNIRTILIERATLHGFILFEHASEYQSAADDIGAWYADGRLTLPGDEEVVSGGLDGFASALNSVLDGNNNGKVVLEV